MAEAKEFMATLNMAAAKVMREAEASGCTDITGFGLFGHLARMLRGKNLSAELWAGSFPAFSGVIDLLREGVIPGAVERNKEFAQAHVEVRTKIDPALVNLGFDAQTSGGLLIAICPQRLELLLRDLSEVGVTGVVIGRLVPEQPKRILLQPSSSENVSAFSGTESKHQNYEMKTHVDSNSHSENCCSDVFGSAKNAGSISAHFGAFMKSVQGAGALDEKTKELILFALVLQSRCAPCLDAHLKKAAAMGITQEQLDEAAWCAIAMGGAPVKMFYEQARK
jgi:AhpD family alkylhydroperoxidase